MPTRTPEDYVGRNVFFTALDDYVGSTWPSEIIACGRDKYSTDYEHSITLWPSLKNSSQTDGRMDAETKHKLLAGNAVRIFNLG